MRVTVLRNVERSKVWLMGANGGCVLILQGEAEWVLAVAPQLDRWSSWVSPHVARLTGGGLVSENVCCI